MVSDSRKMLWAMYATSTLGQCAAMVSGSMLVLFALELGSNIFEVGLVSSAAAYVNLILTIPMGVLSNRFGRFKILLVGVGSFVLSAILSALAQSTSMLILARLFDGFGWSIFMPISLTLVSNISSDHVSLRRYTIFSGLGLLIGPALTTVLLWFTEIRSLFYVSVFLWVVVLVIIVLFIREHKTTQKSVNTFAGDFGSVLRNRVVQAVILSNAGFSFINMIIGTYMPILAVEVLEISKQSVALLTTIRSVCVLFTRALSGKIMDRIGDRWLMMLILADFAVAGFSLGFCSNYYQLILVTVLHGFGWGLIFPVNATMVSEGTDISERTLANASFMGAGNVMGIVTPLVMTRIVDSFGLRMVFYTSVFLPLLFVFLINFLMKSNTRLKEGT
jgi:MFS family permease